MNEIQIFNGIQIFNNIEFGGIRIAEIEGKPYFMATDIAKALGYSRPNDAISAHCRATVKHSTPISGKMQEVNFIPEGDVYRLIARSKLPQAEKFEKWVFDDVLPSIRKHGAYMTPQKIEEVLLNPDTIIKLATDLKAEREHRMALETKIEQDKPKTIFADAVSSSKTSILIGDMAKLLRQNGIEIGQKRLFDWLRNNGYLIKRKGSDWNMPTQRSVEMGLFEIKESTHLDGNGCNITTKTSKVTGKGQVYFINKFLKATV